MTGAPQFYIFHGDDSIRRDEALARMRQSMGDDGDLNRSEFDGAQTPVPDVLAAVKSMPFLADKRLVIVRGLIGHITRRGAGQAGKIATDRLIAELPNLPDHARLVLVEDGLLSEKNRLLKAAAFAGEWVHPRLLKAAESDALDNRAREERIRRRDDAASRGKPSRRW